MTKKKIRTAFGVILAAVASTFMGCMSMIPVSEHSTFPTDGTKYEILGRVSVDTTKTRSGYTRLLEAAKEKYPEADDVVNIVVDSKQTTLFFFFKTDTYVMSGVAINYK